MDFPRALSQIAEIHQQLAKGEIYRGYRSVPIAASGLVGVVAAIVQPSRAGADSLVFLQYWTAVAIVAGLVGVIEVAYNYVVHDHAYGRRRTRQVLGQFLPATVAAAVLTGSFAHIDPQLIALLPGIWSTCFGVGIFASRPYLPRLSGFVALYYFAIGTLLLWTANLDAAPKGWHVGVTFGVGQLLAAAVLYWELERPQPDEGPDWNE
jgi:hypothetical protein